MQTKICGLDEAGRGSFAGPLVGAAVVLPCSAKKVSNRAKVPLRDGKLLSARQRNKLYLSLRYFRAQITVEVISARQINSRGIGWANKELFRRLVKRVEADSYIVDGRQKLGRIKGKTEKVKSVVDADATIPAAILAGIVAKVERDKIMRTLHKQFPRYGWHLNKGYGTKRHLAAIQIHGLTYLHRSVFVTTALRHTTS